MTESEAIEWIKELRDSEEIREFYYAENFIKACDRAIQALEKLTYYKNLKSEAEAKLKELKGGQADRYDQ